MKAVVELGGKQYLVEPGTIFLVDKLPQEKGSSYVTDKVLMILDDDDIVLGKPYIKKAKVTFSVLDQTKRRKIIVQKFRSKKGYLKTRGHRQHATQVQVEKIEGGGKKDERVVEKKKKKTTKKAAPKKTTVKKETPKKETAVKDTKEAVVKKETTKKVTKKTVTRKDTAKKDTKKKAAPKKKAAKKETTKKDTAKKVTKKKKDAEE